MNSQNQQFLFMLIISNRFIMRKVVGKVNVPQLFPMHIKQLDKLGHSLLEMNIDSRNPTLADSLYRRRRNQIGEIAKFHQIGSPIQEVDYTQEQHALWRKIFNNSMAYRQKVMFQRYKLNLQELMTNFDFHLKIPKINDLSNFLKEKTGFQIKPVPGIISQRQFLNCLAFKVFCSGQFIRHPLCEEFAPEPDIIHQYIGHIPAFADPQIAAISQEIGLLSLGASDEDVLKLGYAYLHSLQFGICKEKNQIKVYGAGICACTADIKKIISGDYEAIAFDPESGWREEFNYVAEQNRFWITDSFRSAMEKLRKLSTPSISFKKTYIEKTQSIRLTNL